MLLSCGSKQFRANGFGHLRGQLFDKLLKPWREVRVRTLYLIFRICKEGFKVAVGCGDAVDQIFQDEGESAQLVPEKLVRL